MPTLRKPPRVNGRDVAAPAMALLLLVLIGCPSNSGPGGPAINGVAAPNTGPAQPSSSQTPAPGIVVTPPPVGTPNPGGTPRNATPPPQSLFATPTSSSLQTPSPEALDLQITEGTGNSNYAQNLFIVPAMGDLPHLDPPASRSYSTFNDMGIGVKLASTSGFPQAIVSTASIPSNWSIDQVATLDARPATAVLLSDLIYFRLPGGATASTVASASTVEIDLATVSAGVLLTFSANVNAQSLQTFDGPASNSITVAVLASNEGQVSFTVSSLRLPQFERVTP